jgi:hypothetical protein
MLPRLTPLRRCALLGTLAALLLTVAVPAQEGEKKKTDPQEKKTPGIPGLEDLLKKLPPGIADRLKNLPIDPQELLKKLQGLDPQNRPDLRKLLEQFRQRPGRPGASTDARLGVDLEKPAGVLVSQLGLPEGKGLVISAVKDESAAAKAGLKAHDILMKLAGKDVPADLGEFRILMEAVKANDPVDAVVLRKGKEETVKGVSLPEAPPEGKRPERKKKIDSAP